MVGFGMVFAREWDEHYIWYLLKTYHYILYHYILCIVSLAHTRTCARTESERNPNRTRTLRMFGRCKGVGPPRDGRVGDKRPPKFSGPSGLLSGLQLVSADQGRVQAVVLCEAASHLGIRTPDRYDCRHEVAHSQRATKTADCSSCRSHVRHVQSLLAAILRCSRVVVSCSFRVVLACHRYSPTWVGALRGPETGEMATKLQSLAGFCSRKNGLLGVTKGVFRGLLQLLQLFSKVY